MDVFTYSYNCPHWYGNSTGIRNLYLETESDPKEAARADAQKLTSSQSCDVHIIQKFRLVVEHLETYPAMATIPMHKYKK